MRAPIPSSFSPYRHCYNRYRYFTFIYDTRINKNGDDRRKYDKEIWSLSKLYIHTYAQIHASIYTLKIFSASIRMGNSEYKHLHWVNEAIKFFAKGISRDSHLNLHPDICYTISMQLWWYKIYSLSFDLHDLCTEFY